MNVRRVLKLLGSYRLALVVVCLLAVQSLQVIAQDSAGMASVGDSVTLNPDDPSLVTYYITDGDLSVERDPSLAPVSVIVTTLAAWSYANRVRTGVYSSELALFVDVVRSMPLFIKKTDVDGRIQYIVENETTNGENFAEKWNTNADLPRAFFEWHKALMQTLADVQELRGIDRVGKSLSAAFGESVANQALVNLTTKISTARQKGLLADVPGVGLVTERGGGVPVARNTFFGA